MPSPSKFLTLVLVRKPAAEMRNAIALAEAQLSVQQRYRIEKARALRLLAKDAHSEWMDECVPKLMDMGKDQLVAVAACLNMWRDAWEETHPDGADDPGPDRPQKQLQAAREQLARL